MEKTFKIGFDHCYQNIRTSEEYFALSKRGFLVSDHMVEHPGPHYCRFIKFKKRTDLEAGINFQYLEFVEIPNIDVNDNFNVPGFSLNCLHNLEYLFERRKLSSKENEPVFYHKNYNWKEDSVHRHPGWNFIKFTKSITPNILTWLTEYEQHPLKKRSLEDIEHPNTVSTFHGFIWDLNLNQLNDFTQFIDSSFKDGILTLADGSNIYSSEYIDIPNDIKIRNKVHPFKAVILTCTHWDTFIKNARPELTFQWRGKNAGLIEFKENGWDILVVEDSFE